MLSHIGVSCEADCLVPSDYQDHGETSEVVFAAAKSTNIMCFGTQNEKAAKPANPGSSDPLRAALQV